MTGQPLPENFDPDTTLRDIQLIIGSWPWRGDGEHLALLVGWLDQWLSHGGAWPAAWTPQAGGLPAATRQSLLNRAALLDGAVQRWSEAAVTARHAGLPGVSPTLTDAAADLADVAAAFTASVRQLARPPR